MEMREKSSKSVAKQGIECPKSNTKAPRYHTKISTRSYQSIAYVTTYQLADKHQLIKTKSKWTH